MIFYSSCLDRKLRTDFQETAHPEIIRCMEKTQCTSGMRVLRVPLPLLTISVQAGVTEGGSSWTLPFSCQLSCPTNSWVTITFFLPNHSVTFLCFPSLLTLTSSFCSLFILISSYQFSEINYSKQVNVGDNVRSISDAINCLQI